MVNIVKRMRQELESDSRIEAWERDGWWAGRLAEIEPRSNITLEVETNILLEDTWRRGRLDIAGTKQLAKLFGIVDLGGSSLSVKRGC